MPLWQLQLHAAVCSVLCSFPTSSITACSTWAHERMKLCPFTYTHLARLGTCEHQQSLVPLQEHFDFLDKPANGQHRTTFYCTLARLLFMDDSPQRFRSFVAPLQQV